MLMQNSPLHKQKVTRKCSKPNIPWVRGLCPVKSKNRNICPRCQEVKFDIKYQSQKSKFKLGKSKKESTLILVLARKSQKSKFLKAKNCAPSKLPTQMLVGKLCPRKDFISNKLRAKSYIE